MEVLAVVLIIATLTAIAMPQYRKSLERAKVAEVRQMLPAIYDSCERMAVERSCLTWTTEPCRSQMTFDNLDVGSKIHEYEGGHRTDNFRYDILKGSRQIRATRLGGRWNGLYITYDGDSFKCNSLNSNNKVEACYKMLGFDSLDK